MSHIFSRAELAILKHNAKLQETLAFAILNRTYELYAKKLQEYRLGNKRTRGYRVSLFNEAKATALAEHLPIRLPGLAYNPQWTWYGDFIMAVKNHRDEQNRVQSLMPKKKNERGSKQLSFNC
jgi:hypothetical protein